MPHINHRRGETRTFIVRHYSCGYGRWQKSPGRKGLCKQWYESHQVSRSLQCPCCNPYGASNQGNQRIRRLVFRILRAKGRRLCLEGFEEHLELRVEEQRSPD